MFHLDTQWPSIVPNPKANSDAAALGWPAYILIFLAGLVVLCLLYKIIQKLANCCTSYRRMDQNTPG